jgi:CRP-like cAMP-binding protein
MESTASPNQFGIFNHVDTIESHAAGDVIFSVGDPAACLYVIRAGEVAIEVDGREVERLGEGAMFGEMALVDDGPRSATAVAGTDCELAVVDRPMFRRLVQVAPFFAENVMKVMAARLRRATA